MLVAYKAMIREAVRKLRAAHTAPALLRHSRHLRRHRPALLRGRARVPLAYPAYPPLARPAPANRNGGQHDRHSH